MTKTWTADYQPFQLVIGELITFLLVGSNEEEDDEEDNQNATRGMASRA